MESSSENLSSAQSVSLRLQAATDELHTLEQLVTSGDISPRVLSEFRGAVDSIRLTAFAIQQWTELQQQHHDPYTLLDKLSEERVRRATKIVKDLMTDLESSELGIETKGLTDLFHAIEDLYQRMTPQFKKTSY